MGFGESSFLGYHTTTEPSFTVRPTGHYDFPVHIGSGSSLFAAHAADQSITRPVHETSGSVARVNSYSNFPLQPKVVSTAMVRANSLSFEHCNSKTSPPPAQGKPSRVTAFHSSAQWRAHFDASKDTNKLMVIDFTATWCGPCRSMDAVINDFAAKYTDVEFIKIDVDELHDVAMKYQVVSMPTFLLMKKGNVVDKVVGCDKDRLKETIEHHRLH